MSVHRPSFYAERFKKFMSEKVFTKMPSQLKTTQSIRRSNGFSKRGPKMKEEEKLQPVSRFASFFFIIVIIDIYIQQRLRNTFYFTLQV